MNVANLQLEGSCGTRAPKTYENTEAHVSKVNAATTAIRHFLQIRSCRMYRTGVANPAELAMLTRVMDSLAAEMQIERSSDRYNEVASHLLVLFEASKDENRLLTLMRRSAGKLRSPPTRQRGKRQAASEASPR